MKMVEFTNADLNKRAFINVESIQGIYELDGKCNIWFGRTESLLTVRDTYEEILEKIKVTK